MYALLTYKYIYNPSYLGKCRFSARKFASGGLLCSEEWVSMRGRGERYFYGFRMVVNERNRGAFGGDHMKGCMYCLER